MSRYAPRAAPSGFPKSYRAMKNFLFLIALLPAVAAAFDSDCITAPGSCYTADGRAYNEQQRLNAAVAATRQTPDAPRTEIYDVWESDARGNYHQYLVIPDEYGRPSRITPGLSSGR